MRIVWSKKCVNQLWQHEGDIGTSNKHVETLHLIGMISINAMWQNIRKSKIQNAGKP